MTERIKTANVEELHQIGVDISMSELSRQEKSVMYALIEERLYDLDNSVMAEMSDDISLD